MAQILVGNSNNILTSTLDTTAKTLKINNCTAFDLTQSDLQSVWDTTTSSAFSMTEVLSCVLTTVAGLPVFTYTFRTLPAGVANGDTLLVYLQVPQVMMDFLVLQKIAGATI